MLNTLLVVDSLHRRRTSGGTLVLLLEWLRWSRVLSCVSATGAVFMPLPVFMPRVSMPGFMPVFMPPVFMPVPGCNAPAAIPRHQTVSRWQRYLQASQMGPASAHNHVHDV